jgi:hypothetical protein
MMLTASERDAFLIEHVALNETGAPVRRAGHFALKPITGQRFLVCGRQFDTGSVKVFLATGQWPCTPNPRNHTKRNGARKPRTAQGR